MILPALSLWPHQEGLAAMMTRNNHDEDDDVAPQEGALSKAEFWMRIAGWSFALWSLMVPLSAWLLSRSFDDAVRKGDQMAVELAKFNTRFEGYVLSMERRITILEERQERLLRNHDNDWPDRNYPGPRK
jgi:hypothetical protein